MPYRCILFFLISGLTGTVSLSAQTIIQTERQADSLRRVIASSTPDTMRVNAENALSYYYGNVSTNLDSAVALAREAEKLSRQIGFRAGEARALLLIGGVFHDRGKYAEALAYYFKALHIAEEIADKHIIASALNNIGLSYRLQGKYAEALEYLFKSLRLREAEGNARGIASTLNNIALVFDLQNKYDEALEYHFKSLRLREAHGDKRGVASSLNNIALVFTAQDKYKEALEYHFQSLDLDKTLGNQEGVANALNNIASVYFRQGKYKEALESHFQSLQIDRTLDNKQGIAVSLNNIANVYLRQHNFNSALLYAQYSLALADSLGAGDDAKEALLTLSEVCDSLGRTAEAFVFYKRYTALKDSLFNIENLNQSTVIKESYDAEKRDVQIALLNKETALAEHKLREQRVIGVLLASLLAVSVVAAVRFARLNREKRAAYDRIAKQQSIVEEQSKEISRSNIALQRRNILLEELDKEKNEILGMLAHDLKNPLSGIRSSAEILVRYFPTDTKAAHFLTSIMISADKMFELIRLLLEEYRTTTFEEHLPLQDVPLSIVSEVLRQYQVRADAKNINIEYRSFDEQSAVTANDFALRQVLDNLISNAIKYAPPATTAQVLVNKQDDGRFGQPTIRIEIHNEGSGISDEDKKKLFTKFFQASTKPTGGESSTGLGLYIVKKLVAAQQGYVRCESEPNEGVTFIVELPAFVPAS
jgi:signal transduction histidine kinase